LNEREKVKTKVNIKMSSPSCRRGRLRMFCISAHYTPLVWVENMDNPPPLRLYPKMVLLQKKADQVWIMKALDGNSTRLFG
jgi:hypothetical protein